jgi:hypothetical protein
VQHQSQIPAYLQTSVLLLFLHDFWLRFFLTTVENDYRILLVPALGQHFYQAWFNDRNQVSQPRFDEHWQLLEWKAGRDYSEMDSRNESFWKLLSIIEEYDAEHFLILLFQSHAYLLNLVIQRWPAWPYRTLGTLPDWFVTLTASFIHQNDKIHSVDYLKLRPVIVKVISQKQ